MIKYARWERSEGVWIQALRMRENEGKQRKMGKEQDSEKEWEFGERGE